ncbi:MAG: hypothetical protein V3R76_10560 [Gammaproteobacteria bacterium]
MKITLCFIKAEIGSMGGHIYPSKDCRGWCAIGRKKTARSC